MRDNYNLCFTDTILMFLNVLIVNYYLIEVLQVSTRKYTITNVNLHVRNISKDYFQ